MTVLLLMAAYNALLVILNVHIYHHLLIPRHMASKHIYNPTIEWTGNKGAGTFDYRSYSRSHTIMIEGKQDILASSDSSFRGEKSRHNPEDLFVSSIAGCHMLWYLHLCADNGVVVLKYIDRTEGAMIIESSGAGYFESVTLRPEVLISPESDSDMAKQLHTQAHKMCFIANSCNFPIHCDPSIRQS